MAYNFLGLVNDVNNRVNEVELNSSNFLSASGFYNTAKEAINGAIRQINYEQYEWPFNHVTQEDTLTAGVTRYSLPQDTKTVDFDTFRIKASDTLGNETSRLRIISYEEYLDKYVDQEYNYNNANTGLPSYVFRTPDMRYGLVPAPDKAYELIYEYYALPFDLINSTDIPNIPEQFRNVIVDGAMHYVYLFRGNTQDAAMSQDKFIKGIGQMRSLYINRTDYVRTTYIERVPSTGNFMRVK
jgi:hypothetical protein